MAKIDPIDITNPAGDRNPKLGDDDIRTLARAVIELINKDHYVGVNGGAGVGYSEDAAGEHAKITLNAPLTDHPTNETNKGHLYLKDVSGKAELFWQDEDGKSYQLTEGGKLKLNSAFAPNDTYILGENEAGDGFVNLIKAARNEADDADVAMLSDAARMATDAPPGEDTGVVNKKYVDDSKTGTADLTISSNNITTNGATPATWTDLDLSSVVGLNSALVYIRVRAVGGTLDFQARTKGHTKNIGQASATWFGAGVSAGTMGDDSEVYLLVLTDSNGVIQIQHGFGGANYSLWVEAYLVVN